jgi:hypothetical protein
MIVNQMISVKTVVPALMASIATVADARMDIKAPTVKSVRTKL